MPFSIYLHYPFCTNACSYCDFYKELRDPEREKVYCDALLKETSLLIKAWSRPDRTIGTIFIGGGTPTLAPESFYADWLALLKEEFLLADDLEFTVENNPEAVSFDKLAAFRELGVNRPTFGIQSFNTRLLNVLGRKHEPNHSRQAVYWVNALGYKNFGVDLLFGLPGQTSSQMSKDLDELLDLEPPHISYYQLTVEPGTTLHRQVTAGELAVADDELSRALYRGGCEKLTEAGYERYEVSSFALPGRECRHNLAYWEGGDYVGLGPAAHSFLGGIRSANVAGIDEYIRALKDNVRPSIVDRSSTEERMVEAVMLGLRMTRGIDRRKFAERFGHRLEDQFDRKQYDLFVESGLVIPDRGRVMLSDEGLLVADDIIRRLLK